MIMGELILRKYIAESTTDFRTFRTRRFLSTGYKVDKGLQGRSILHSLVTDSAMYLFKINSPNIGNIAMSL